MVFVSVSVEILNFIRCVQKSEKKKIVGFEVNNQGKIVDNVDNSVHNWFLR